MKIVYGLVLAVGIGAGTGATAQDRNFLYVQTDNKQPFYVKIGSQVYSSSLAGYLVVPQLKDSAYLLQVGFPRGSSEQQFVYKPEGKDQGFVLKEFGEKGWGLFNLQTMAVTMAGLPEKEPGAGGDSVAEAGMEQNGNVQATVSGDTVKPTATGLSGGFIDRLALVVDDPSIRVPPVVAAPPRGPVKVPETPAAPVVAAGNADAVKTEMDSAVAVAKKPRETRVTQETVQEPPVGVTLPEKTEYTAVLSNVVKKSMTELKEGYMGVFIDEYSDGRRDTIRVFVPKWEDTGIAEEKVVMVQDEKKEVPPPVQKEESMHFLDFSLKNGEGDPQLNKKTDSVAVKVDGAVAAIDSVALENPKPAIDSVDVKKDSAVAVSPVAAAADSVVSVIGKEEEKAEEGVREKAEKAEEEAERKDVVVDSVVQKVEVPVAGAKAERPVADEADFKNLRKAMAAETEESDMVFVALKQFRKMAFTTTQIRNLGALFLKEEELYRFLDAAYPYVSDKEQFSTLENMLKDPYHIQRFKALIAK